LCKIQGVKAWPANPHELAGEEFGAVILIVWGTIIWMSVAIWRHYRWVAVAQVPYFIWVSLATVLQLSITVMNWGRP
jgi:tryptophan-rich sensory protein